MEWEGFHNTEEFTTTDNTPYDDQPQDTETWNGQLNYEDYEDLDDEPPDQLPTTRNTSKWPRGVAPKSVSTSLGL
jgi:hypothetical protein